MDGRSVKVRARLELAFGSPEEAKRMLESLKADDDGYASQRVEGSTLIVETEGESPGAVRQTLEDYLACINGAVAAAKGVRGSE